MVAIPLNAFTCHGSGLASLSRNLIKTFNIREIPDVDGTPPSLPFDSIQRVSGIRLHDTFLSTFIYEVNALLEDTPRCIFPTVLVSRYSVHRSLRSERLIVDPHGRKKER